MSKVVYITEDIVRQVRDSVPLEWGPIGEDIFLSRYSRIKPNGEQEDWYETCARVVNGNLNLINRHLGEEAIKKLYRILKQEAIELYHMMVRMVLIPGGRHIWATGISDNRQFLNNCHCADFTDHFSEHFAYTFMRLMEGGGVGANYSDLFVHSNPNHNRGCWIPENRVELHLLCRPDHPDYNFEMMVDPDDGFNGAATIRFHQLLSTKYAWNYSAANGNYLRVEDSREGWCKALSTLLESFFTGTDTELIIDLSNVRPFGSEIREFGGRASGPSALALMLYRIARLLNRIRAEGRHVKSMDYVLIDHYIAQAVVAGGTRRSARMAMKYWKDDDIFEFIHCKADSISHWTTNISVVIDKRFFNALKRNDEHAVAVLDAVVEGMLTNGEPGLINASKCLEGEAVGTEFFSTNPCGEIAFVRYHDMPAFDVCCLGHVNLAMVSSANEAEKAFRLMTRFLIRATFAPSPDPKQEMNIKRNRRIGVGFLGYHSWLTKNGIRYSEATYREDVREFFKRMKQAVDDEARKMASALRIPEPVKKTTIAPTGTVSLLPGVTSGLQPVFSKYYIRRVRYSASQPELEEVRKQGGRRIVKDIYADNTYVVEYVTIDPIVNLVPFDEDPDQLIEDQEDLPLDAFLRTQAMFQQLWADNAISITINVDPSKYSKADVINYIRDYMHLLKGLTLYPVQSRPLSPLERITREQLEALRAEGYLVDINQKEEECVTGCPVV